jgi:hypothetical protein
MIRNTVLNKIRNIVRFNKEKAEVDLFLWCMLDGLIKKNHRFDIFHNGKYMLIMLDYFRRFPFPDWVLRVLADYKFGKGNWK